MFLKRFNDIELVNEKGPLAVKVSTFGLRLDAAELARSHHEKTALDEVSSLKKGEFE